MKLNLSRKGFTLVEIMIVVVIIGLLAALAIPAFKKVRNNAVEKSLLNDARQITSAVQQYCTENSSTEAPVKDVARFLNGNKLSSGVVLMPRSGGQIILAGADLLAANQAQNYFHLDGPNGYFFLGHPQFDKEISSNATVKASGGAVMAPLEAKNSIRFTTADGQPQAGN